MLMKLTPGVNFINILRTFLRWYFWAKKIQTQNTAFVIFGDKILYKKCARKTLMKFTPVLPTNSGRKLHSLLNFMIFLHQTFALYAKKSGVNPLAGKLLVKCAKVWRKCW